MIDIIKEKKGFWSLREQWDLLAKSFNHPLMCHDWYYACADSFYSDGDLRIVVLRRSGELFAAAPLALRKRNGTEWLELLGAPFLSEPGGVIYRNRQSLEELLAGVLALRMPVLLHRLVWLPELGNFYKCVRSYKALVVKRPTAGSFFVPLNKSKTAFWDSLKSRRRSDFRRARRKAERAGVVRAVVLCPEPKHLQQHLATAFNVEAAGWKGRSGSAILKKRELTRFFETYAELACVRKTLRLCFLYIGEHPAAMQIGLQCFNRFWALKIGYDEIWEKCSPGMQLTQEIISHAIDSGLEAYEFLGSEEKWLHAWPVKMHSYQSIGFYPFGPRGLLGLGTDFSGFVRKLLKHPG